ncbi:MAG TPA: preprotein translocase subunit YajC [Candidatus Eisenbacteria bacterium]|nr:preprotein translocase subunit YajC [Candidatus Eisenbacteria bacterium]
MNDVAWAQTAAGGGTDPRAYLVNFLPLILVFVIFYFLILRPQTQKQKEVQKMIQNLKRGDRVVSSGGIYGEVVDVKPDTVILRVADNVKLEFAKSAIVGMEPKSGATG